MYGKRGYLIILMFVLTGTGLRAQNDSVFKGSVISSFTLFNTSGHITQRLNSIPASSLTLFVFLSPECPLCQNYSSVLNSLQTQYQKQVNQYGIIPGKAYSPKEMNDFAQKYHLSFPLFIDSIKQLSNYLQATTTPEAILLDENNQLIYKGAIDNLLEGLGKRRLKPTETYLQNAITLAINNKPVAVKRTRAIGCKINNY